VAPIATSQIMRRTAWSSHHQKLVFFLSRCAHDERTIPIESTRQYLDSILFDKPRRRFHGDVRIRGIIRFKDHHLAAQHATPLIEKFNCDIGSMDVMDRAGFYGLEREARIPILIGSAA